MVAVYTDPSGVLRRKGAQHRVILFFRGSLQEPQNTTQILPVSHAGKDCEHTGLIQSILDALVFRQCLLKRGSLRPKELAAAEGFHHRDSHSRRLAPAVKGRALIHTANGIFSVAVVVGRVDAEHKHIQKACIQHFHHHRGRMGRKSYMADNTFLFQLLQIRNCSAGEGLFQIRLFVNAMNKPKIYVICPECLQLPIYRPLDLLQIQRPSIFSGAIIRPEMDLKIYLFPAAGKRPPICREGNRVPGGHIEIVDTVFHSQCHGGFYLFFPCRSHRAVSQPQNTNLFPSVGKLPVFHMSLLFIHEIFRVFFSCLPTFLEGSLSPQSLGKIRHGF